MALVLTVGRADEEQIAPNDRRRVRHVVWIRTNLLHHVEGPDDIRIGLALQRLVLHDAVVLAITEAVDVEAKDDAAIADVIEPVSLDQRRRCDALERPIVRAARLQFQVRVLPEELAVGFAESHENAAITWLLWIAQQLIVGTDESHSPGYNRVAVAL